MYNLMILTSLCLVGSSLCSLEYFSIVNSTVYLTCLMNTIYPVEWKRIIGTNITDIVYTNDQYDKELNVFSDRVRMKQRDLIIKNVQFEDAGTYIA